MRGPVCAELSATEHVATKNAVRDAEDMSVGVVEARPNIAPVVRPAKCEIFELFEELRESGGTRRILTRGAGVRRSIAQRLFHGTAL